MSKNPLADRLKTLQDELIAASKQAAELRLELERRRPVDWPSTPASADLQGGTDPSK
jgi:hypothetical protein